MSNGSTRRPTEVPEDEKSRRWEKTFERSPALREAEAEMWRMLRKKMDQEVHDMMYGTE